MKMSARLLNGDAADAALDRFEANITSVALPRAFNKLRDQAKTAGFRRIADIYSIGPRTLDQYTTLSFATAQALQATISVKGRGFPLYVMQPRQTRAGVSVLIKGRRIVIPHTFLAVMPSGHVGVFARGAYGGKGAVTSTGQSFGRFTYGRKRLPISELFTFGPPDTLRNAEVTLAMNQRIEEQAPNVLRQEIRFASRG